MSIPGDDLPSLQNLIKRDPLIYKEDFMQQVFCYLFLLFNSMIISKLNLLSSKLI